MISLENIRNRSGLLLVVIGFAMLAFILTDLMSSSNGASSATDLVVGEVGDDEIDYQVFEQRVQQTLESQRQSNPNVVYNMRLLLLLLIVPLTELLIYFKISL